jgi:hypothetical protein
VTNNHVTEGSETVEIIADDQKVYTAKVVATDPPTDIALLKVDGRNGGAPVDPAEIRRVALMTVEGELDDISGAIAGADAAARGQRLNRLLRAQ